MQISYLEKYFAAESMASFKIIVPLRRQTKINESIKIKLTEI